MTEISSLPHWHLTAAETAKLIRAALKRAFPGVKFSVTCSRGSAINVNWVDGPTGKLVDAVAKQFAGGGFDGSIDLRYSVSHWLMPDGTVTLASNAGTACSGGYVSEERHWMPDPAAKLVHLGADFVFCHRQLSERFLRQACQRMARNGYRQFAEAEIATYQSGGAYLKNGRERLQGWDIDLDTALYRETAKLMIA